MDAATGSSSVLIESLVAAFADMKPKIFAKHAKALAKMLDIKVADLTAAVVEVREATQDEGRTPFVEHAPADIPVHLATLLTATAVFLRRYIVLTPEQVDAAVLWVAHTHVYELFQNSPLLLINAPERECGKSLVQEVLARLSQRSMQTANVTLPVVFRTIEAWAPTVYFDEIDTFFGINSELPGVLNKGHHRDGYVWRIETDKHSHVPTPYKVFCPKSLAGIAQERHLPDSTLSRGIMINMRRKRVDEKVERWRSADPAEVESLARGFARMAVDYADRLRTADPLPLDALSDRALDNWTPLLTIAHVAGAEWEARARAAAIALSGKDAQPMSVSNELLCDIREVLGDYGRPRIPTAKLLSLLVENPEFSWAKHYNGQPLTSRQLAKHLQQYGIKPKTVRMPDGDTPKGYEVADFQEAFACYLKDDEEAARPPTVPQVVTSLDPITEGTAAAAGADATGPDGPPY